METEMNPGKRILLVEDERLMRESIRDLLIQNEHSVVEANNGAEAFALFIQGQFDLVMTDWLMPFLNGDELAARIRRLVPRQPILIMTGHDVRHYPGSPFNAVLHKPFDNAVLQEEIAKLL